MTKLIDITGKALSGEWGKNDETGVGIPVLRTTNFTNEGVVNYNDVVTRIITKNNIDEKYLRKGDIIIEKSGGSDKYPVGRVIYFDGEENTYLFNNFTNLIDGGETIGNYADGCVFLKVKEKSNLRSMNITSSKTFDTNYKRDGIQVLMYPEDVEISITPFK